MNNIQVLSKDDLNRLQELVTKCEENVHESIQSENQTINWKEKVTALQDSLNAASKRARSYKAKLMKIKELREANKIKIIGVDYDNEIERELNQMKTKQQTQSEEIDRLNRQNLALIAENKELNKKFEQIKLEKLQNQRKNDQILRSVKHRDELLDAISRKYMTLDDQLRAFTAKKYGLNATKIEKNLKNELDYIDCQISCCQMKLKDSESRKQKQIGNLRSMKKQIQETEWKTKKLPVLLR